MKTNSKRRVLVSSLSMLLVAAVSLGAATYAWFTSSTTATASKINVKTIKSSELQISKSDKDWNTIVNYGVANKVLLPASTVDGVAWFTANAETKQNFAKPADVDFDPVTNASNYYFTEELNVRNNGAADVTGVKIELAFPASAQYARVAVQEVTDTGVVVGDFKESVYDNAGAAYEGVKNATTTEEITPKTSYTIQVGDLKGKDSLGSGATTGEAKYYKIFVWFEGQDVECIDTSAGQEIPDVSFTVSGTTADQTV